MLNIVYLSPPFNNISHFVAATYNEKEQRYIPIFQVDADGQIDGVH